MKGGEENVRGSWLLCLLLDGVGVGGWLEGEGEVLIGAVGTVGPEGPP